MSRAVDSITVATSRRPLTRSVEPVDVRSTTMSAMPRWGRISAAPETGTTSTDRPARSKKLRVDARERRGHPPRAVQVIERGDARLLPRRHHQAAAGRTRDRAGP